MITCEELDFRLKCLYPNFKKMAYGPSRLGFTDFMNTYKNLELEEYTTLLHGHLVSEGFTCTYKPDGIATAQDIWLYMLPERVGIMRITIRYDGWVYADCDTDIPYRLHGVLNGAAPIWELMNTLHEVRRLMMFMPPCRTCHYSSDHGRHSPDIYCGKGLAPTHECTGYLPMKE